MDGKKNEEGEMNAQLISCPACAQQVSKAAASCIHCGHPLKSAGISKSIFALAFGGSCLLMLALGLQRVGALTGLDAEPQGNAASAHTGAQVVSLSDRELALELQAYVLRVNRTLPHRPNPMLTLERVSYKPKPHRLAYDYELSAGSRVSGINLENVRPALMRRYCQEETFQLASANGVAVTWRYLELGRVVHQETIDRCEMQYSANR